MRRPRHRKPAETGGRAPTRCTRRMAGVGHGAVLSALHRLCFPHSPWSEAEMAALLAQPACRGLLAVAADGTPCGFVLWTQVAGEADILTIGVAPPRRGQGLGRRLMEGVGVCLRRKGGGRLTLEVAEDDAAARMFYERLGFKVMGRRYKYYARPSGRRADALCLSCAMGAGPSQDK